MRKTPKRRQGAAKPGFLSRAFINNMESWNCRGDPMYREKESWTRMSSREAVSILLDERRKVLKMLSAIEWKGRVAHTEFGPKRTCPCCSAKIDEGHRTGCALGEFLGDRRMMLIRHLATSCGSVK